MKKFDNFCSCLEILKGADFDMASENDIYRTGVIGQFQLTFEQAWKSLQAILQEHGVDAAKTGSPREIIKTGFELAFVPKQEPWLEMLKDRNVTAHVYDEVEADEVLERIEKMYIQAFEELEKILEKKVADIEKGGL